jgi:hypothetical protein
MVDFTFRNVLASIESKIARLNGKRAGGAVEGMVDLHRSTPDHAAFAKTFLKSQFDYLQENIFRVGSGNAYGRGKLDRCAIVVSVGGHLNALGTALIGICEADAEHSVKVTTDLWIGDSIVWRKRAR